MIIISCQHSKLIFQKANEKPGMRVCVSTWAKNYHNLELIQFKCEAVIL